MHDLRVLEYLFDKFRPLQIELANHTDELHVVDQDLIEGRSVIPLIFRSLYGIVNKENNDQGDEKEDADQPENVPGRVRALPTLEF